jgi:putative FmdB family regulatory protein
LTTDEDACVPVYEYRCDKGHTFEAIQRMSDEPLSTCEVCGKPAQRVLYAPAIHFKGTGFHNTDYGTRKRPREGDKADGAAKDGASSSDGAAGADGAKKVKEATPADTAKRATGP